MNVKIAMKEQGLRYFSSLTPKQKDASTQYLLKVKLGLHDLNEGLSNTIAKAYPLDEITKTNSFIYDKIKGSKMFLHNGIYCPLNIQEII